MKFPIVSFKVQNKIIIKKIYKKMNKCFDKKAIIITCIIINKNKINLALLIILEEYFLFIDLYRNLKNFLFDKIINI